MVSVLTEARAQTSGGRACSSDLPNEPPGSRFCSQGGASADPGLHRHRVHPARAPSEEEGLKPRAGVAWPERRRVRAGGQDHRIRRGGEVVAGSVHPRARTCSSPLNRSRGCSGINYLGHRASLLGLVRAKEGVAVRILLDCGVDLADLREEVIVRARDWGLHWSMSRPRAELGRWSVPAGSMDFRCEAGGRRARPGPAPEVVGVVMCSAKMCSASWPAAAPKPMLGRVTAATTWWPPARRSASAGRDPSSGSSPPPTTGPRLAQSRSTIDGSTSQATIGGRLVHRTRRSSAGPGSWPSAGKAAGRGRCSSGRRPQSASLS
jgi:hypothetical protein